MEYSKMYIDCQEISQSLITETADEKLRCLAELRTDEKGSSEANQDFLVVRKCGMLIHGNSSIGRTHGTLTNRTIGHFPSQATILFRVFPFF